MGLDSYFWSTDPENITEEVDFESSHLMYEGTEREEYIELFEITEIAYWRKHWGLHDFMKAWYQKKGGQDRSFNCVNLLITEEILQDYENKVFYEEDCDWWEERDRSNFAEARREMKEGKKVFFNSWY